MCPIRVVLLSGFMRMGMGRKVSVRMMSKQSCMENGACSASDASLLSIVYCCHGDPLTRKVKLSPIVATTHEIATLTANSKRSITWQAGMRPQRSLSTTSSLAATPDGGRYHRATIEVPLSYAARSRGPPSSAPA